MVVLHVKSSGETHSFQEVNLLIVPFWWWNLSIFIFNFSEHKTVFWSGHLTRTALSAGWRSCREARWFAGCVSCLQGHGTVTPLRRWCVTLVPFVLKHFQCMSLSNFCVGNIMTWEKFRIDTCRSPAKFQSFGDYAVGTGSIKVRDHLQLTECLCSIAKHLFAAFQSPKEDAEF